MDFTVIQSVRQRFGENTADVFELFEIPLEQEAPFVGPSKDFRFSCPNVDQGEIAVLQFESLAVTPGFPGHNIIQINGFDIPGGITAGPAFVNDNGKRFPIWKTHSLLVPVNVLRDENVLHIESGKIQQAHESNFDNFIIDNIVVFFKTRSRFLDGGVIQA